MIDNGTHNQGEQQISTNVDAVVCQLCDEAHKPQPEPGRCVKYGVKLKEHGKRVDKHGEVLDE